MNFFGIIGNLCSDPKMGETKSGKVYCRFNVAVSRNYTNKNGERLADFFDITVWDKQAELCNQYLTKGSKVSIIGTIENNEYTDKDGNVRKTNSMRVEKVEFIQFAKNEKANNNATTNNDSNDYEQEDFGELPF